MPMFYTPKPRQFHYQPRFYDPEKERWEALKQKYAERQKAEEVHSDLPDAHADEAGTDADLQYFQSKVRSLDRQQRQKQSRLGVKDLFRKRPMPTFNYTPRFQQGTEPQAETSVSGAEPQRRNVKIKRRFDIADDDYMKPMPAGRIMLYAILVCALLYWIFF